MNGLMLLTPEPRRDLQETGVTREWVVSERKQKRIKYVILCHLASLSTKADTDLQDGASFMAVQDLVFQESDVRGRWDIHFRRYAELPPEVDWEGRSMRPQYIEFEEFFDPHDLDWRPHMPIKRQEDSAPETNGSGLIADFEKEVQDAVHAPPAAPRPDVSPVPPAKAPGTQSQGTAEVLALNVLRDALSAGRHSVLTDIKEAIADGLDIDPKQVQIHVRF